MPETAQKPEPLTHRGTDKSDERLASEAVGHLARVPALQLIAELLTRLREMQMPWWTPEHLRKAYGAGDRMSWLAERPDVRQRITSELTGLAPKAARKKAPDFQAALIDSVIDDGDISPAEFEAAFDPVDLAVYGPAADLWRLFRRRMPWEDDATAHQDLIGWLIGALLADKSALDGSPRTPILTPWHVRTAIDGRVWHSRIPLDVRVEIDEARLRRERERPGEAFHAAHDLAHAPPALIAASIPLKDLIPVLDVAGRTMGFEGDAPETAGRGGRESMPPSSFAGSARPPPGPVADEETSEPPGPSPFPAGEPALGSPHAVVSSPPQSVVSPPPPARVSSPPPVSSPPSPARVASPGNAADAALAAALDAALDGALDEGPSLEVGVVDPEDLPSIGDEDDPMARTNPWELQDGMPPIDEGSAGSPASAKRGGRRRR